MNRYTFSLAWAIGYLLGHVVVPTVWHVLPVLGWHVR